MSPTVEWLQKPQGAALGPSATYSLLYAQRARERRLGRCPDLLIQTTAQNRAEGRRGSRNSSRLLQVVTLDSLFEYN